MAIIWYFFSSSFHSLQLEDKPGNKTGVVVVVGLVAPRAQPSVGKQLVVYKLMLQ
jgi:hypothetical protein